MYVRYVLVQYAAVCHYRRLCVCVCVPGVPVLVKLKKKKQHAKSLIMLGLCSFDCPGLAHTPAVYLCYTEF